MAKARTKKKAQRSVTDGIAHVHASFNNTVITITDRQGNALGWATAGSKTARILLGSGSTTCDFGKAGSLKWDNKPSDEGIYRHFMAVAESTKLPVVIYNVPGRTGKEITFDIVERLAEVDNIVAIKEAGGSVDRASKLVAIDGIDVISGDDSLTLPMIAVGAIGVISVTSNVVPKEMRDMVHAALEERQKRTLY